MHIARLWSIQIIGMTALLIGCSNKEPSKTIPPVGLAGTQSKAEVTHPIHKGQVLEVIEKEGFIYFLLGQANNQKEWVALTGQRVHKGEHVSIEVHTILRQFQSRTLQRTFDKLILGRLLVKK